MARIKNHNENHVANDHNLRDIPKEKRARGGKREGAGRKPDAFKAMCNRLINLPVFEKWAESVLRGEDVEPHVTDGIVTMAPASVNSRTYLWKTLAEYGQGKPVSMIEMPDGQQIAGAAVIILPSRESGEPGRVK